MSKSSLVFCLLDGCPSLLSLLLLDVCVLLLPPSPRSHHQARHHRCSSLSEHFCFLRLVAHYLPAQLNTGFFIQLHIGFFYVSFREI